MFTISDRFCTDTKTKPKRASVHTYLDDDFGAISETKRSFAAPTSKVERNISDKFRATKACHALVQCKQAFES